MSTDHKKTTKPRNRISEPVSCRFERNPRGEPGSKKKAPDIDSELTAIRSLLFESTLAELDLDSAPQSTGDVKADQDCSGIEPHFLAGEVT